METVQVTCVVKVSEVFLYKLCCKIRQQVRQQQKRCSSAGGCRTLRRETVVEMTTKSGHLTSVLVVAELCIERQWLRRQQNKDISL